MEIKKLTGNILFKGDIHFPYEDKNLNKFLKRIEKKYNVKHIIDLGDLFDNSSMSYHEKETDQYSVRKEFQESYKKIQKHFSLYKGKWKITLVGNHDKLPNRKLKTIGIDSIYLKNTNDLFNINLEYLNEYLFYYDFQGLETWLIACKHDWTNREKNFILNKFKMPTMFVSGHKHSMGGISSSIMMNGVKRIDVVNPCLIDENESVFKYSNKYLITKGCTILTKDFVKIIHLD